MIYLDNGATSFPKPKEMLMAMNRCSNEYCGNPGRSGHKMSIKTGREIYKVRKSLGQLFNIDDPSRIIFTKNTTEALNLGISGLVQSGDHVITTSMEHNSVLRPVNKQKEKNAEITIVKGEKDGSIDIKKIERAIRENTKLIAVTAASNITGTIMPIKEIGRLAKKYGIVFLVDGAQAAGAYGIDIKDMEIDMLAFPGHKGLLGPTGTGGLYVSNSIDLEPILCGGTGTEAFNRNQPKECPDGFEAGTLNAIGIIGLGASVYFVRKTGAEFIGEYEQGLIRSFDEAMGNMENVMTYGPDCQKKTGISLFNVDGMGSEEVVYRLDKEYGIAMRGGYHCAAMAHQTIGSANGGAVRLSVGPFNTHREIQKSIDAIYKISRECVNNKSQEH